MTLREFLRTKTNARELCVIRESGWIVASFWIDYEDLFCGYLDNKLGERKVKLDCWDYIPIVNDNNACIKIPCHYIEV
jgi:hypothetical protein